MLDRILHAKIPDQDDSAKDEDESFSGDIGYVREEVSGLVSQYGEAVAVSVRPLDGSEGFSINGDEEFVSASMIKLLVLAEYMNAVDEGRIDPGSNYVLNSADIVGGTGLLQGNSPGSSFSYDDLARRMIADSDNTATNVLIDLLGIGAINSRAASMGLGSTILNRKMMDFDSGTENYISANDAAKILASIANHTLASEAMCERAESFLMSQTDNEGLAQGLPDGVRFGHKTGTLDSVRHDGGIVYSSSPYVVVVLTTLDASIANNLMTEISAAVYEGLG